MLLVSIAETAGVDQGQIAGYLTVSVSTLLLLFIFRDLLSIQYAFAPMVALYCAAALKVIDVIQDL